MNLRIGWNGPWWRSAMLGLTGWVVLPTTLWLALKTAFWLLSVVLAAAALTLIALVVTLILLPILGLLGGVYIDSPRTKQ